MNSYLILGFLLGLLCLSGCTTSVTRTEAIVYDPKLIGFSYPPEDLVALKEACHKLAADRDTSGVFDMGTVECQLKNHVTYSEKDLRNWIESGEM